MITRVYCTRRRCLSYLQRKKRLGLAWLQQLSLRSSVPVFMVSSSAVSSPSRHQTYSAVYMLCSHWPVTTLRKFGTDGICRLSPLHMSGYPVCDELWWWSLRVGVILLHSDNISLNILWIDSYQMSCLIFHLPISYISLNILCMSSWK